MEAKSSLSELWRFQEVIKNFVSQDLKVKYRRSFLGFFWSLLNPLLQMAVISVVFSVIFKFPVHNYSLYVLSGLIPWTFLVASIDGCSMSIVAAEGMIKRQYFPKLVFPLSVILQNLVTFVLSLVALLCILGWPTGFTLSAALLVLPLSFVCIVAMALGIGAFAAVVTVYFRDVQHLITVFLSAWFYLTPIIYPLEIRAPVDAPAGVVVADTTATPDVGPIPHQYRFWFKLNPMYAIIEMFHRPIYEARFPTRSELLMAIGTSLAALGIGLAVFRRYENQLIFNL